jgi:hypothetical protein
LARNSLDISKAEIHLAISEFDPSQGSQPLSQLEIVSTLWAKSLHFKGISRIYGESPVSEKWQL